MAERKVMEQITHPFLMKLHYAFQVRVPNHTCLRVGMALRYLLPNHALTYLRTHLLPIHAQNASRLYFVMDYLPGGEIFFHLSKCDIPRKTMH